MVAYAEGALCVADELCIDIHLVQCSECREELEDIGDFNALFLEELTHPEPHNDLQELLDRLLDVESAAEFSADGAHTRRTLRATLFRFSVTATLAMLIFVGGAFTWTSGLVPYLKLPTVEAETGLPIPMAWQPWLRRNNSFDDMEMLEAFLTQPTDDMRR